MARRRRSCRDRMAPRARSRIFDRRRNPSDIEGSLALRGPMLTPAATHPRRRAATLWWRNSRRATTSITDYAPGVDCVDRSYVPLPRPRPRDGGRRATVPLSGICSNGPSGPWPRAALLTALPRDRLSATVLRGAAQDNARARRCACRARLNPCLSRLFASNAPGPDGNSR